MNISATLETHNMMSENQKVDDSNLSDNINDFLQFIPSGFKFLPTEQELILGYLRKKVMNEPLEPNLIPDVEIYKHNPEQLSRQFRSYGENEWYFFSPRDRKYKNGERPKRSTKDGYWKASGKCQLIHSEDGFTLIGKWRTLVYYEGSRQQSKKTNWIMREYYMDGTTHSRTTPFDMKLDDWVLCKIYKNNKNYMKSSVKEDAYLGASGIEPIQIISSSKILPQSQPQLSQHGSNNLDPIHQLNTHNSTSTLDDDVWNSSTILSQSQPQPQLSQHESKNLDPIHQLNTHNSTSSSDDDAWNSSKILPQSQPQLYETYNLDPIHQWNTHNSTSISDDANWNSSKILPQSQPQLNISQHESNNLDPIHQLNTYNSTSSSDDNVWNSIDLNNLDDSKILPQSQPQLSQHGSNNLDPIHQLNTHNSTSSLDDDVWNSIDLNNLDVPQTIMIL